MNEGINFLVGLDVHEDTIALAICEPGREPSRLARWRRRTGRDQDAAQVFGMTRNCEPCRLSDAAAEWLKPVVNGPSDA